LIVGARGVPPVTVGVAVGLGGTEVLVGVFVREPVGVFVGVFVREPVAVTDSVAVGVMVHVTVGVAGVGVLVGVFVREPVGVFVGVFVREPVAVTDSVAVGVMVHVTVGVFVGVGPPPWTVMLPAPQVVPEIVMPFGSAAAHELPNG
jgi:hypothetical protein